MAMVVVMVVAAGAEEVRVERRRPSAEGGAAGGATTPAASGSSNPRMRPAACVATALKEKQRSHGRTIFQWTSGGTLSRMISTFHRCDICASTCAHEPSPAARAFLTTAQTVCVR